MALMRTLKSINFKIIVFAGILAAVFLTIIISVILVYSRSLLEKEIITATDEKVALYKTKLEEKFLQVANDLNTLKLTPVVEEIYLSGQANQSAEAINESGEVNWKNQLAEIFVAFAESNKIYNQMRLIDKSGQELVRVDYLNGEVVKVKEADLQNKFIRPYVTAINGLQENEIYISNANLNREGSPPIIQEPFVPVIRYGVPIFDEKGERLGMLVANVNVSDLINSVSELKNELSSTGQLFIIDQDGYYVAHSDLTKVWGRPEDLASNTTFSQDYPGYLDVLEADTYQSKLGGQYLFSSKIRLAENNSDQYLNVIKLADSSALFYSVRNFTILVGFVGLGFFMFVFLVFYLFIRYLLAPLSNLTLAVSRIGQGDFSTKVKVEHDDEIGMVARAFNSMSERLSNIYDTLEQQVNFKTKDLSEKIKELEDTKLAMLNVLEDAESEKAEKEILANDLLKFKQAVDAATDQIVITDPEGIVVYGNPSVKKMTGYDVEEALGKKAGTLWKTPMPKEYYENMWDVIKNQKKTFKSHLVNRRKNGELYDAEVSISPVLDKDGGLIYFIAIERDITREKEYETTAQRLKLATESANIGIWEWDVQKNELKWDDKMYEIYGIEPINFSGAFEAWQSGLHPDDKVRAEQEVKDALAGKTDFKTEFRVVWPNGQIHHIKAAALVEKNKQGEPVRMVGVNWDITHDKEVDQAKSEFVSLASHQLRTPLSSINWYAEMLLAGDAGKINEDQKKYLEEIYIGNQRMVELVNALLNVSRLELGTFVVEPEAIDIKKLAEDSINEQKPQLLQKQINLKSEIAYNLPIIQADPKLLHIVVQNLLSNAIKYTPAEGEIKLHLSLDDSGNNLQLTIADNGIGIPQGQQDKIFSKLFRADNVKETDTEGTGLGLYIVKSIIEHSGGSIKFESPYKEKTESGEIEIKGTKFDVILPITGMQPKKGDKTLD